jgi:hypothetical protein
MQQCDATKLSLSQIKMPINMLKIDSNDDKILFTFPFSMIKYSAMMIKYSKKKNHLLNFEDLGPNG